MKKFLLIWFGELISSIGSGMTAFALSVYVYQATGSVSLVSVISLAAFLPTILLSPLGGVLADRYDRRLLMIIGDLFSGLGLLYVLWNIHIGTSSMLPVIIGVAFNAVFVALLEPSFRSTITDLLRAEEYAKASGMVQIAGNARYLISPALAGILLVVSDIRLILLLDICTFFITVVTVALVRKSIGRSMPREKQSALAEIRQGFSVLKANKGVCALVVLMACVCFFIGFLQTLVSPMVLAVSDAKTVGILESVCAVGMLLGSVWIGIVGIKQGYVRVLSIAGMGGSIFMALAGVCTSLIVTGAGIFLFFLSLPFMNTSADVLVRSNVPNEVQGRVWGIISLLSQAGTAVAYVLSGVLADHIFEPLLSEQGLLAGSIGRLIGVGQGRGIGFMLVLSGLGMIPAAFAIGRSKSIQKLENSVKKEEPSCT